MTSATAEFDAYATNYDQALASGLHVSGEDKHYFLAGRVAWLAHCLTGLGERPQTVLDFGCGTGATASVLLRELAARSVVGVDVSADSIVEARRQSSGAGLDFLTTADCKPVGQIDVAYCNGVFHHIVPEQRPAAVTYLRDCLRPAGWLALWENNPWNPGTRYVMSRIPFDRDAQLLSAATTRRLLRDAGFEIVRTDYLFYFPRLLSLFRPLERYLVGSGLGAQYQVLARRK